jgi:hypothetical protein
MAKKKIVETFQARVVGGIITGPELNRIYLTAQKGWALGDSVRITVERVPPKPNESTKEKTR